MSSKTDGIGKKLTESITKRPIDISESIKRKPDLADGIFLSTKTIESFCYLSAQPCSWTRKIAKDRKLSVSTISQHIQKLIDSGLVQTYKIDGKKLFAPYGMVENSDIKILSILQKREMKDLFCAINNRPGILYSEITRFLHIPNATIKRNISILSNLGLVSTVRDGRLVRIYPSILLDKLNKKYAIRRHAFIRNIISQLKCLGVNPKIETTMGQKIIINAIIRKRNITILLNTNPITNI